MFACLCAKHVCLCGRLLCLRVSVHAFICVYVFVFVRAYMSARVVYAYFRVLCVCLNVAVFVVYVRDCVCVFACVRV